MPSFNPSTVSAADNKALDILISQAAGGDISALEKLYTLTKTGVYGFALSILKNPDDARRVLHDTYLSVWASAHIYESVGKPMMWLISVAKKHCYASLHNRKISELISGDTETTPKAFAELFADAPDLGRCVTLLNDDELKVIVLRSVTGLTYRETAELLSLSLPTVRSRYKKGMKKLKQDTNKGGGLDKNIEKSINAEVTDSTPDLWTEIEKDVKNGKGSVVDMPVNKRKGKLLSLISTLAAALVLISVVVYAIANYDRIDKNAVSTICVETTPKIELSLNAYNKVLDVTTYDDDGERIIEGLKIKGLQLSEALNSIFDSMYRNRYLTDLENTVLISVDNKETKNIEELQKNVLKSINIKKNNSFKVAAVVQKAIYDDNLQKTADSLKISSGKAKFIEFLQKNGVTASDEDLSKLSIHELNLIFQSLDVHESYRFKNDVIYGGVGYKGAAEDEKHLKAEKVKALVLKDAAVNEKNVKYFKAELDFDCGKMVYRVSFKVGNTEYIYTLDAISGEVFNKHQIQPNINF